MFQSDVFLRRFSTFAIWALPIITFTIPTRLEPSTFGSLDTLAILKLLLLVFVFLGGLAAIFSRIGPQKKQGILSPLIPFYVFFGWAVLSVLWTPRLTISIGQAGGLASLLVLASLIGMRTITQSQTESVLRTLCRMLAAFSLFVLAVHLFYPDYSGLDRRMLSGGGEGVVHPTAAGANASLGFLLSVVCLIAGQYKWAPRAAFIGCLIHGTVLYFASSRMALLMAMVTLGLVLFVYAGNLVRAATVSTLAMILILIVLIDPSFGAFLNSNSPVIKYITRGQSTRQLQKVSGREEMWTKIWKEYSKSKLIGHGYFITSEKGEVEVWEMKANHTAHNIYLQILVSTGAIGLLLFAVALGNLFLKLRQLWWGDDQSKEIAAILAVVLIWYFGWSMLCVSFMGPIRSESVVFFVMIGIGLGQLARISNFNTVARRSQITGH